MVKQKREAHNMWTVDVEIRNDDDPTWKIQAWIGFEPISDLCDTGAVL